MGKIAIWYLSFKHPVSLTQRSPKFSLGCTPTGKIFIGVHPSEIEIAIFYWGAPQWNEIWIFHWGAPRWPGNIKIFIGVHPNKAKFSLGCRNPIGAWPSPWPGDCKYTLINRCFNGGISRWLFAIFRPFLPKFKKQWTFIVHLTLEEMKKNIIVLKWFPIETNDSILVKVR